MLHKRNPEYLILHTGTNDTRNEHTKFALSWTSTETMHDDSRKSWFVVDKINDILKELIVPVVNNIALWRKT